MNRKDAILIDIWWTSIIWWIHNNELKVIENLQKYETLEYKYDFILEKIDLIIKKLKTKDTNFIWISLNWQVNNWYVYFSRILWWIINLDLASIIEKKYWITTKIENDVNCMALWYSFLSGNNSNYIVYLNIWTGIRTSYIYNNKLLKWNKWFFWEIRDSIYVKELEKEININDLVCWRWVSNIYELLSSNKLDSKSVYKKYLEWDVISKKTIKIFIKYFIYILERISYTFNPEIIIIDWSLKSIIFEKYETIIFEYEKKCEKHFIATITISGFENTTLYGALKL